MSARGIRRQLERASARLRAQVRQHVEGSGALGTEGRKYAGGLAYEGWDGGYLAALSDVQLALSGVKPATRGLWERESYLDRMVREQRARDRKERVLWERQHPPTG